MPGTGSSVGAGAGLLTGNPGVGAIVGDYIEKTVGKYVKGKGTPHNIIFENMPKFFYAYGSGDYGGVPQKFNNEIPGKGLFVMESGVWLPGLSSGPGYEIYKAKGGPEAEKRVRKPNERVTKDPYFTMLTIPGEYYRGMEVIGGVKYDVNHLNGFKEFPHIGNLLAQYMLAPTGDPATLKTPPAPDVGGDGKDIKPPIKPDDARKKTNLGTFAALAGLAWTIFRK